MAGLELNTAPGLIVENLDSLQPPLRFSPPKSHGTALIDAPAAFCSLAEPKLTAPSNSARSLAWALASGRPRIVAGILMRLRTANSGDCAVAAPAVLATVTWHDRLLPWS